MNELQTFDFNGTSIRMLDIGGEPYFVGKDVAEVLGYTNSRKAIGDHVDEEDKNTVTIRDGIQGNPNITVINESGLYSLILSSKLPAAKDFKRWVTSEVLPAIRKTGKYAPENKPLIGYDLAYAELIAGSEAKVFECVAKCKLLEKHPSLSVSQVDTMLRLLPLYPTIQYVEIAKLAGVCKDTLLRCRRALERMRG